MSTRMRHELRRLAIWSHEEVGRLGIPFLLGTQTVDRARTGLGGSHTVVTYPPLDALEDAGPDDIMQAVEPVDMLNLYFHIAFCEYLCPFCHYETVYSPIGSESERVRAYVDAVAREFAMWADRITGSRLTSLYFGGGTPTSISTDLLLRLIEQTTSFKRQPGFTACIETSPLATVAPGGAEKLAAVVAAGIDRISIGIQSFDSDLLRRSRGYDRHTALDALNTVLATGVTVNIDLIQDLPDQDDEHLIADLSEIARFQPDQVTWYILRLRPGAGWYPRYRSHSLELGDALESVRRRLFIRAAMRELGYRPAPGGRFVRDDTVRDHFKEIRSGTDLTLLGVGVSAYSHGWGFMFRNLHSRRRSAGVREYVSAVESGRFPIASALPLTPGEVVASRWVKGIRAGIAPDPEAGEEELDYLRAIGPTVESLLNLGLIQGDARSGYSLTELGALFEEEICSLFYSPGVRGRLRERGSFWSTGAEEAHKRALPVIDFPVPRPAEARSTPAIATVAPVDP